MAEQTCATCVYRYTISALWREYECRKDSKNKDTDLRFSCPDWKGKLINNKGDIYEH